MIVLLPPAVPVGSVSLSTPHLLPLVTLVSGTASIRNVQKWKRLFWLRGDG